MLDEEERGMRRNEEERGTRRKEGRGGATKDQRGRIVDHNGIVNDLDSTLGHAPPLSTPKLERMDVDKNIDSTMFYGYILYTYDFRLTIEFSISTLIRLRRRNTNILRGRGGVRGYRRIPANNNREMREKWRST